MLALEVRFEARQEIQLASLWYELRQPGLGYEFRACLRAQLDRIRRLPRAYPRLIGGCRKAALRRFPYVLIYTLGQDRVILVAVFHANRRPRDWTDRVKEPALVPA